ncbi:MAG: SMP-30/gluconolactonase/LRE family protein, partial [Anaerolineales bacterium]|nr:SMP-30/gluconolactonase/LRE family protein [Anaerolineales bacterium]
IDSSNNLYIADRNNHRIQIFNNSGVYMATLGETGVAASDNTHFDQPVHLRIYNNTLYVADAYNHRVQIFDITDPLAIVYVDTIGTSGEPGDDNAHFNGSFGVFADANKIYVADTWNNRIQIFDATTYAYLFTIGGTQGTENSQFQYPVDVAVDSSGMIYVADIGNERVQVFDSSYIYTRTMGVTGIPYETDENHYYLPFHGDATQDGGWLITEKDGHRVIKINADGTQAWAIGEAGIPGDDETHFYQPHGVAERGNKVIYVTDTANHRLVRYAPDGSYLSEWGGFGTGDYQFNWPTSVALGQFSDILVVDTNNQRVQIYDLNFFYKGTLGVTGESGNDNIHFNNPLDVAVDADGRIYVADEGNNRVQVFDSNYVYQKTIGVTGICGNDIIHLCGPHALDFDAEGRLYVADSWNQRVQIFDTTGEYLDTIGGQWGGQPAQFRSPFGVAVSATGQVLISDSENHRLQIFEPFEDKWTATNTYGFGNANNGVVMALEIWNESLFATAANWEEGGSVWRYEAPSSNWVQVSEPGFSNTYTQTNSAVIDLAVFNEQLYASTGWSGTSQPGQLWRSSNGTSWNPVVVDGFGNPNNRALTGFGLFNGYLYLGTNNEVEGAEIWRSQTGDSGEWTKVFTSGGENVNNHIANSFLEFEGYFYVSFENDDEGVTIWRTANGLDWTQVNTAGFGDAANGLAGGLGEFGGYLYIGTRNDMTGAQLWRSDDGVNWQQVVGNGFGDLNNIKIDATITFNNALYVVTENNNTGLEVWRTQDGVDFVQVNRDGFDGTNTATLWSSGTTVYHNQLYIGTTNWSEDAGGGVWVILPTYDLFLPFINR